MASINPFSPIQEGTGTPSPDNVRPIKPAVSIAGGKNLLEISPDKKVVHINSNMDTFTEIESGIQTSSEYNNLGGYLVLVKPNTTYTYSANFSISNSDVAMRIWEYKTKISVITAAGEGLVVNIFNPGTSRSAMFTTSNTTNYIVVGFYTGNSQAHGLTITNMQLEEGSIATTYESYQSLDIYGGYLDIVNRRVVEEQTYTVINNLTGAITSYNDNNRIVYSFQNLPYKPKNSSTANLKCSYFKSSTTQVTWTAFIGSTGNFLVYIPTTFETAKSWKEYTIDNPLEICYELSTPIVHYLTQTQMAQAMSQLGIRVSSMMERKKLILLNSPHVETASGSIASFQTDMKAPLKECKIHFLPVQSGSGDPSPTNVRPITGWTGVDVCHRLGLWDGEYEKGVLNSAGEEVTDKNRYRNVGYISVLPSRKLTFKYERTAVTAANIYVCEYDAGKECVRSYWQEYGTRTLNSSTYYIRFFMDTAFSSSYTNGKLSITYAPDLSDSIPVSFGANGTIYGGYVDLVTGELVAEWEVASGLWGDIKSGSPSGTTGFYQGILRLSQQIKGCHSQSEYGINAICNVIGTVKWEVASVSPEHFFSGNSDSRGIFYIYCNYSDDQEIQVAAKLETPITYQLTPQQIKSLLGHNNIWSNANGNIEIKYWKH